MTQQSENERSVDCRMTQQSENERSVDCRGTELHNSQRIQGLALASFPGLLVAKAGLGMARPAHSDVFTVIHSHHFHLELLHYYPQPPTSFHRALIILPKIVSIDHETYSS